MLLSRHGDRGTSLTSPTYRNSASVRRNRLLHISCWMVTAHRYNSVYSSNPRALDKAQFGRKNAAWYAQDRRSFASIVSGLSCIHLLLPRLHVRTTNGYSDGIPCPGSSRFGPAVMAALSYGDVKASGFCASRKPFVPGYALRLSMTSLISDQRLFPLL